MIKGNKREPYIWKHHPSGREFEDKDEFDRVVKAWNRRHDPFRVKTRHWKEMEKARIKRDEERKKVNNEITILCNKLELYEKERDNFASLQNLELINQISHYEREIQKLKLVVDISKKSLKHGWKESVKKFQEDNPSTLEKEIKELKSKLRKL